MLSRLNQTSRISKLFSGINPWAGSIDSDILCDMTMLHSKDPKLVGVSRDSKVKIWSPQVKVF